MVEKLVFNLSLLLFNVKTSPVERIGRNREIFLELGGFGGGGPLI